MEEKRQFGFIPQSTTETELVDMVKSGDSEALSLIYDSYVNRIYRYALARTGRNETADEVTERAFIKMLDQLPKYRSRKMPFSSWLMRIAREEVAESTGRGGKQNDEEFIARMIDGQIPEEAEKVRALVNHIRLLPELQADVLALRYASGLSREETSKVLRKKPIEIDKIEKGANARLASLMDPKPSQMTGRNLLE